MSQQHYNERVRQRFKMKSYKMVSAPLVTHFTLSSNQSPSSVDKMFDMKCVPFEYDVGTVRRSRWQMNNKIRYDKINKIYKR